MKGKNAFFWFGIVILTVSCTSMQIDNTITKYNRIADTINLGDDLKKVLSTLLPTQDGLPNSSKKSPDKYIKDGVLVEIYYMRSNRYPDDLTTDDEFVPYVFNNGILVGIGWASIGGPKTVGQVVPTTNINTSNTTIVH